MLEYLAENASLRQWSRRLVANEINLEDFRAARRSIIESLEAGKVATVLPSQAKDFADTLSEASHDPKAFEESGEWSGDTATVLTPAQGVPVAPSGSGQGLDANSIVLAGILVVAAIVAVGVLVYVFIL